jgi:hypothetical protein
LRRQSAAEVPAWNPEWGNGLDRLHCAPRHFQDLSEAAITVLRRCV